MSKVARLTKKEALGLLLKAGFEQVARKGTHRKFAKGTHRFTLSNPDGSGAKDYICKRGINELLTIGVLTPDSPFCVGKAAGAWVSLVTPEPENISVRVSNKRPTPSGTLGMTTIAPTPDPTIVAHIKRLTEGPTGRFQVTIVENEVKKESYDYIRFKYGVPFSIQGIWPNQIIQLHDGSSGMLHTPYANIDATGSVTGMKSQGYWPKDAKTIRRLGFIYNLSSQVVTSNLDLLSLRMAEQGRNFKALAVGETTQVVLKQPLKK